MLATCLGIVALYIESTETFYDIEYLDWTCGNVEVVLHTQDAVGPTPIDTLNANVTLAIDTIRIRE